MFLKVPFKIKVMVKFTWIIITIIRMSKKSSGLNYFSEDSAGFRVQPKTVLIMSLVYIGIVVLLHIYSKLGASPVADQSNTTAQPSNEQPGQ